MFFFVTVSVVRWWDQGVEQRKDIWQAARSAKVRIRVFCTG